MTQDKYFRARLAYHFFHQNIGNRVTVQDIILTTSWARSSVKTYFAKKWDGIILKQVGTELYEVCMPSDLSEDDFVKHHSQIDDDIKI